MGGRGAQGVVVKGPEAVRCLETLEDGCLSGNFATQKAISS